jgi:hypothetical protein
MRKFSDFINAQELNNLEQETKNKLEKINESSLSRLWQYVQDDEVEFGVLSAQRYDKSKEANKQRHQELKDKVNKLGYGYIELRGGFVETKSKLNEAVINNKNDIKNAIDKFDDLPEGWKRSEALKIIKAAEKYNYNLKAEKILKYKTENQPENKNPNIKKPETEETIAVEEDSLFIPGITRSQVVNLGIIYDQDSVLHKGKTDFVEIGTSERKGINKILSSFKLKDNKENLTFSKQLISQFYSKLKKGNSEKFLFQLKEKDDTKSFTSHHPDYILIYEDEI